MKWSAGVNGWNAYGVKHSYMITQSTMAATGNFMLARWEDEDEQDPLSLISYILQTAVQVTGPLEGQRIAEAFENGWLTDPWGTVPVLTGWTTFPQHPGLLPPRAAAPAGSFITGPARDISLRPYHPVEVQRPHHRP